MTLVQSLELRLYHLEEEEVRRDAFRDALRGERSMWKADVLRTKRELEEAKQKPLSNYYGGLD